MKLLFVFLSLAALLTTGCSARQSVYKRFPLSKGIEATEAQRVFSGVLQSMRTQAFVDAVAKRFPKISQEHWAKTDIRFEWVEPADGKRTYFVAFGVKDTTDFPDIDAFLDFAIEYGKAEAEKLRPAEKKT